MINTLQDMIFRAVFSIGSLFFLILVLIAYISKKFKTQLKNKIFIYYMCICIVSIIFELITNLYPFIGDNTIIYAILTKIQNFTIIGYAMLFLNYCYILIYKSEETEYPKFIKNSKLLTYHSILGLVLFIVSFGSPVPDIDSKIANFINKYLIGSVFFFALTAIIILILCIKKRNDLNKRDKFVFTILILAVPIYMAIQFMFPTSPFYGLICCIQVLLIYSYYENPDVLVANEIASLNETNIKNNLEKTEFLNKMTLEMVEPIKEIKELSETILVDGNLDETQTIRLLNNITSQCQNMTTIVNSVINNLNSNNASEVKEEIGESDYDYIKGVIKTYDLSKYKVLLVDDNDNNIKTIKRILDSYGLQVTVAKGIEEGVNKIKSHEIFNLILVEELMENGSGIDLLHILQRLSNIFEIPKVVLISSTNSKSKYIKEGFADCLEKPFNLRDLENIINKHAINKE